MTTLAEDFFTFCKYSYVSGISSLIHEVDVNDTIRGISPLFIASEKGHSDAVHILLANGARINKSVNKNNQLNVTPLFIASEKGHLEVVNILLDNGASISKMTKDRIGITYTPLVAASKNGHSEIVSLLLSHITSKRRFHKGSLANTLAKSQIKLDKQTSLYFSRG